MTRACAVDGCETKHYARGWCFVHYMQWFRTGTIRWVRPPTPEERFWANVDKTDTCWLWTGALFATGYGQIKWQGKTTVTHGLAWKMANGPVPAGYLLHHVCAVKRCVRPSHLRLETRKGHGRAHKETGTASGHGHETHCPQGHAYSEANTYVDKKGSRHCKECSRERKRASYQRKRASSAPS